MKGEEDPALGRGGGTASEAEGTANAKALSLDCN